MALNLLSMQAPTLILWNKLFMVLVFQKLKKFKGRDIDYFNQNDIHFLLNREVKGFSTEFAKSHGPAICSMGVAS